MRTPIDVGVWLARTEEDRLPQREIDHLQEESAEDPHIPWKLFVQLQRQPYLFLRFTFEVVQAQLLAQSRRGLAIVTFTLSASALMTLSKKGLKVSVEGLSTKFCTMEISHSANSSGDRSSKNPQIEYSSMMPHKARNGVNVMAISGL